MSKCVKDNLRSMEKKNHFQLLSTILWIPLSSLGLVDLVGTFCRFNLPSE